MAKILTNSQFEMMERITRKFEDVKEAINTIWQRPQALAFEVLEENYPEIVSELYDVRLHMVVDKSGMKLREDFYLPYTLFQGFMQSSESNCVSCVTARSFS